jgi:hypothetical protein
MLLAAASGCLSCVNPIKPPPAEVVASYAEISHDCRRHVYVFLIHGMDPLDCSNLYGLHKYIVSLGFSQVYLGQMYHFWQMRSKLLQIHKEDPAARFVLIGFSWGANLVRDIALDAGKQKITIDLLVYLGGNTLENTPHNQPPNVLHIANILASGCIWNGCRMDHADNINYDDVYHFGSPCHGRTLDYLARELAVVAHRVVLPPHVSMTPPPIPASLPPQWDFLQRRTPANEPRGMTAAPVSRLKPVAQQEQNLGRGGRVGQ